MLAQEAQEDSQTLTQTWPPIHMVVEGEEGGGGEGEGRVRGEEGGGGRAGALPLLMTRMLLMQSLTNQAAIAQWRSWILRS